MHYDDNSIRPRSIVLNSQINGNMENAMVELAIWNEAQRERKLKRDVVAIKT